MAPCSHPSQTLSYTVRFDFFPKAAVGSAVRCAVGVAVGVAVGSAVGVSVGCAVGSACSKQKQAVYLQHLQAEAGGVAVASV